jgi:hypothetical protein
MEWSRISERAGAWVNTTSRVASTLSFHGEDWTRAPIFIGGWCIFLHRGAFKCHGLPISLYI